MITPSEDRLQTVEPPSHADRTRLVQFCAWLTGDREIAEDLAQETMIIAWQQQDQLRDPARYTQWLEGIARNLCRHWWRSQRRQRAHRAEPTSDHDGMRAEQSNPAAEAFDLEVDLDRHELAHLLDRALALLPPLTRTILIERFIHESPQAEVARQLGLTEGAVEARVQRGKLTLRRVLTTDLHEEAAAYGLTTPADSWQETRIWCPYCGKQRFHGYFTVGNGRGLVLRCFACGANLGTDTPGLFDGIRGYRAALSRFARWYHPFFQQGLANLCVPCLRCGRPTRLHLAPATDMPHNFAQMPPATPNTYGFWTHCTTCNDWDYQSDLAAIACFVPEVQQFWRAHPRMITLPEQPIETNGSAALLIGFQDVTGSARIEVVFAGSTLTFLSAHHNHC